MDKVFSRQVRTFVTCYWTYLNEPILFFREIGVGGGMGVTRVLVKKYISKETIKQFQKIMLKYFE